MTRVAHLVVACDADPDGPVPWRRVPPNVAPDALWTGVSVGIETLRRRLEKSRFHSRFGHLPITWLLRADRQISETYGTPAFAFERFAPLWTREQRLGSEIGWHPHLYRWNDAAVTWQPSLDADDDLDVLRSCLSALRRHADIRSARTGWTYHSNGLMKMFASEGVRFDASAIPGSLQGGRWRHDWRSAPRTPYRPSAGDYRAPARSPLESVCICELPVIVRRLARPPHALRYVVRLARRSGDTWESARWQGVVITRHVRGFRDAVAQTLQLSGETAFLVTYFHTGELLRSNCIDRFERNLDTIVTFADRGAWELRPATLSAAGHAAEQALGI